LSYENKCNHESTKDEKNTEEDVSYDDGPSQKCGDRMKRPWRLFRRVRRRI